MFSVIAVIIFVALGSFLTFLGLKQKRDFSGIGFFAGISYTIAVIWIVDTTAVSYTNQISDFATVKQINMQINLDTERRDKLICVLKEEMSKYPEIEKQIIMNIKPEVMLLSQFPNLKSNETIVSMVNQIISLENSVYDKRFVLIRLRRDIYYREMSPWVIYRPITYASFFKEANPFEN